MKFFESIALLHESEQAIIRQILIDECHRRNAQPCQNALYSTETQQSYSPDGVEAAIADVIKINSIKPIAANDDTRCTHRGGTRECFASD